MLRAGLWSSAESLFRFGLQFGVSVLLARILSPRDFGIYALTLIFSSLSGILIDGGFSSALIQRQNTDQATETAVFQYNVIVAAALSLAIAAAGPFVAWSYGFPILRNLLFASAALVFLGSFSAVPGALMHRRLEFARISKISIVSSLLGSVVAVGAALSGAGVWTFVIQSAVATIYGGIATWFVTDWRPRGRFDLRPARSLAGYGSFLMLSGLLEVAYTNGYPIILAKAYSVTDVAFFNRGQNVQANPSSVVSGTIQRLLFPALAGRIADSGDAKEMTRRAVSTAMAINAPIMLFLALFSELVITVVYGEKWLPAAPVLAILSLSGIVFPLQVINLQVLLAHGKSNVFLRLEIAKKVVGVTLVIAGCLFGVIGIALGQALFSFVALVLNAYPIASLIRYPLREQLRDCVPAVGTSVATFGALWIVARYVVVSPPTKLLAILTLGGGIYAIAAIALGIGPFREMLVIIRARRGRTAPSDAVDLSEHRSVAPALTEFTPPAQ